MSDLIAEAAEALSAAPIQAPEVAQMGESQSMPSATQGEPVTASSSSSSVTQETPAPSAESAQPSTSADSPSSPTGNVLLNALPTVDAPNVVAPGAGASDASDVDQQPDGSVANASSQEVAELPVVDSGNVLAGQTASSADLSLQVVASVSPSNSVDTTSSEPLPRESHLMLLEAKLASFRAKLVNAERVALNEFEAIVGHIRALL